MLDVERIRQDFPVLNRKKLIYMDNGATTQKPRAVIDRITEYYTSENSNIHRSCYLLSILASEKYDEARRTVAGLIGVADPAEIIFTKGATESFNLLSYVMAEGMLNGRDNVVVTELEHHSNYLTWQHACRLSEAEFRVARADGAGRLDLEDFRQKVDGHTKLVAITMASNVTGQAPPLEEIIQIAKSAGAMVLLDATQAVQHRKMDVKALDCDFLAFSGHKAYGPMGTGVLYGKARLLEQLPPFMYGGDMVETVGDTENTYKAAPYKWEAGTVNVADILGLEAAVKYLLASGLDDIKEYENSLGAYLLERVKHLDGYRVLGEVKNSTILSFVPEFCSPYDIGVMLAANNIAIRTGKHCAYPYLRRLGADSTCRLSMAFYNTIGEIDLVVDTLASIRRLADKQRIYHDTAAR